jgi:hypothetical protein
MSFSQRLTHPLVLRDVDQVRASHRHGCTSLVVLSLQFTQINGARQLTMPVLFEVTFVPDSRRYRGVSRASLTDQERARCAERRNTARSAAFDCAGTSRLLEQGGAHSSVTDQERAPCTKRRNTAQSAAFDCAGTSHALEPRGAHSSGLTVPARCLAVTHSPVSYFRSSVRYLM